MAQVYVDAIANTSPSNTSLEVWLRPLLARLPGAVEAVVQSELRAAIEWFYRESRAWRITDLGPYSVAQNQDVVYLNPADQYARVIYVLGAFLNEGGEVTVLSPVTEMPQERLVDRPRVYFMETPDVLRLYPKPATTLGSVLYVNAALTPAADFVRVPDIAVSHHFDAILDAALARLLAMPNKPFTNFDLAAAHDRRARKSASNFRGIADRAYSTGDKRWAFPPFA